MSTLRTSWSQLRQYPSAIGGLFLIAIIVGIAIYTIATMPLSKAIALWRSEENVWLETPRNARPAWVNWLPGPKLPPSIVLDSATMPESKVIEDIGEGLRIITISFEFDYFYDDFPQELTVFFTPKETDGMASVSMTWETADGRTVNLGDRAVGSGDVFRLSQDTRLQRRMGGHPPEIGLFAADLEAEKPVPVKGTHRILLEGFVTGEAADLDAKLVAYGKVFGLAGTDHRRRDITVALLWGAPIALVFGFLAAVGSTLSTMVIAAIGVWYGRWVEALIQRITEVNLILPTLPILIMVGTLYSKDIWVMLTIVVLLGIFSGGIKTYRAMFLQVKEAPYIEAARAYGAGSARIVLRYMIPRVVPVLVPQFVVLIPSYVFLEATLTVLGLGDPTLPTWGKVLEDAYSNGALYNGFYYWVLIPAVLLMVTGLGFAMLGFALDRIFNPRLRGM